MEKLGPPAEVCPWLKLSKIKRETECNFASAYVDYSKKSPIQSPIPELVLLTPLFMNAFFTRVHTLLKFYTRMLS